MNPNILSQLNDIQTPEPIGLWPLAWGWWALILITLFVVVLAIKLIRQRIKLLRAKKQALKLLKQAEQLSPLEKVTAVSQILKRSALAYLPRTEVAQLNGETWAKWLNQFNQKVQISPELLTLSYQGTCSEEQANLYYLQAQQWLTKILPLSPNALIKAHAKHVSKQTDGELNQGANNNV